MSLPKRVFPLSCSLEPGRLSILCSEQPRARPDIIVYYILWWVALILCITSTCSVGEMMSYSLGLIHPPERSSSHPSPMGTQVLFVLFLEWRSSAIWRSCKKRQCVPNQPGQLVSPLLSLPLVTGIKLFLPSFIPLTAGRISPHNHWWFLQVQTCLFHSVPRELASIADTWELDKEHPTPCCSFAWSLKPELHQSITHWFFFLCFSFVRLIPVSSCGVATLRTPTSAKQRKGLRWTGPCVHQERWERALCVLESVCVQLGMLSLKLSTEMEDFSLPNLSLEM